MSQKMVTRLYPGGTEETKEAERLLDEAEIPYQNMGPTFEEGSALRIFYECQEYYGLKGIKTFIKKWRGH